MSFKVAIFAAVAMFAVTCNTASESHPLSGGQTIPAEEKGDKPVEKGIWGGEGIIFDVGESGVSIEFSCADGRLDHRPATEAHGRFSAVGVFIAGHPGPIRADREPVEQRARYEGKVSGKNMTLRVVLIDDNEEIGSYSLEHGRSPRLRRCK